MIKNFSCEGFRNICCDNLEFAPINILIGPNNAGKSNFIRALSFAANMVNNPKSEPTAFLSEIQRNGWERIANRRGEESSFRLAWRFELDKKRPVEYTLCANVGDSKEKNYLIEESLDSTEYKKGLPNPYNYFKCHSPKIGKGHFSSAGLSNEKNKLIFADIDKTESVLLQMDNLFFRNMEMFSTPFIRDNIREVLESLRTYFKSFYAYACTVFDLAAVCDFRDGQGDGSVLNKDGANFVNVFNSLVNEDETFKERYLRVLKRLIPDCEEITVKKAGGKIWLELLIAGCYFPLSELSDGTIHLLLLLLLLNLSEKNAVSLLAIDEPEMNLHPAWQRLLANEILRGQGFKQCFISTHSPDFLDEFTPGFLEGSTAVFVFDPSSKTTIKKLDPQELRDDLTEWTLGDLYRVGDPVIGGWPQ